MLAHMDDGMGIEGPAQPGICREITVRRHQIGIMVAARRIDVVAARRLYRDDDIAEAMDRQHEAAFDEKRIALHLAPALLNLLAGGSRQCFKELVVIGQRQGFATLQ